MRIYRNDSLYGSGVTNLEEILCHEIGELGNTDILTYCLDNYDIPDNLTSLIDELIDAIDECDDIDDSEIRDISRQLISCVSEECGVNCKYGVWGCTSRQDVIDLYEGNDDNVSEYYIKKPVIFSDLGKDGILIGMEEKLAQ